MLDAPIQEPARIMSTPLESLIASGTRLWLDSVDPKLVAENRALGATGATSNPVIIGNLLKTGRFDEQMRELMNAGHDDAAVAWMMTDQLVGDAQQVFHGVWTETGGNDGYVSFELDPLIEDPDAEMPHAERVARYIELGEKWSSDHDNRMIKVPATPAGIDALEELCASGVTLNVTLIFSRRQYEAARDAIWRGAQRRSDLATFKSVYSVFVSRVDAYTMKEIPELSPAAQGVVGIVNAKRMWRANQDFWTENPTPLQQEIIFASTGTKNPDDVAWKYVEAFAGSDIQTNPPATNDATQNSGVNFSSRIGEMPNADVLAEIDRLVDIQDLEDTLMEEGIAKFADPHKGLLDLIAAKREAIQARA